MGEQDPDSNPTLARKKLIELLENDEGYRFTDQALAEGRTALRTHFGKTPSEFEIVDYLIQPLREDFPILKTPMGEPPGSRGIGWVMNNPDGNHTYIKLKIDQDGVFDIVWILSCKTSKHKPT